MSNFSPELVPPCLRKYVEDFHRIQTEVEGLVEVFTKCNSPDNPECEFRGLYMEAYSAGVLSVLKIFSETLSKIQERIHTSGRVPLLDITNECEHMTCILAYFSSSVEKIRSRQFDGCKILDLCQSYIYSGLPPIKLVFTKIRKLCLKKLLFQSKLWLIEGKLHDPFSEFFIKSTIDSGVSDDTLTSTSTNLASCTLSTTTNSISSMTLMSIGTNKVHCFNLKGMISRSMCSNPDETFKYEINLSNLPLCIPLSVASKMLFIAEALAMCQSSSRRSKGNLLDEYGISEESLLTQFSKIEDSDEFAIRKFSSLVDNLWLKVNKRIREISEEVGNVSSELALMSEIYLLGRGDVFHEFLTKANYLLTADTISISSRSLNVALRDAFYNVYLNEVSELVDKFNFVLPSRKKLKPGIKTKMAMSLEYKVKWPLNYLFTNEVMKVYNQLFRFLMLLKNSQIALISAWKHIHLINEHTLRVEFIEVKMHLLATVVNLQNYCFTNVIAHETNALLAGIVDCNLITDLQKSLHRFLYNVSSRLFISNIFEHVDKSGDSRMTGVLEDVNKKVYNCFLKIFGLCDLFTELFNGEKEDVQLKLSNIKVGLFKVLKNLFSLLKTIDQNCWLNDDGSAWHLYNLIMCLDYNKFYQKKFEIHFDDCC